MIPNASITAYSTSGDAVPGGGVALTAVTWPAGRLVPCRVVEFSETKLATLQATGIDASRSVMVRAAALRAMGITPAVDDRLTLADAKGLNGTVYAVKSVRKPVAGNRLGASDEVVLLLGRAS